MIKVIVSHDVDHLYRNDHYKDLSYPKLWVRETIAFLTGKMSVSDWFWRMLSPFKKVRHHVDEVAEFDLAHGVPSTFFFGMAKGLGMSYNAQNAVSVIWRVREKGLSAGVHGIAYADTEAMKEEYTRFEVLTGQAPRGIRMHYVRYDETTFEKLAACGYLYDSTEFVKADSTCIKDPYSVDTLVEFPLTVMDGYLPYKFEQAKLMTLELLKKAKDNGQRYVSILFHDYMYCKAWSERKLWYEWLIAYLQESSDFEFVSYEDARKELLDQ